MFVFPIDIVLVRVRIGIQWLLNRLNLVKWKFLDLKLRLIKAVINTFKLAFKVTFFYIIVQTFISIIVL
jgi:hypothetical protein